MKQEKTLNEKREELFNKLLSKISVSFNDWQDFKKIIIEQDKQFIKEILDEANKYLKNHGEELEKWSEGDLDIESNQWIRAWIKDYVKTIKQKAGFEELE